MAARDCRDECFFRVDSGCYGKRQRNRMRRSGRGNLYSAVEKPAVLAAVAVVGEHRSVPLPCDRGGVFAQRSVRMVPALPAAHGGENENGASLRSGRAQPIEEADAFAVDENVDVPPHAATLVHDAVERPRRSSAEGVEGFANRRAALIELNRGPGSSVRAKRFWKFHRDQGAAVTDAFTHTTGGSPSAISVHVAPSLAEPNSFPLRVPK